MLFQTWSLAKLKQHQARKNLSYACRSTDFSKEMHYRKKLSGQHKVNSGLYTVHRVAAPEEWPILPHAGFGYRISVCLQPITMYVSPYLLLNTSPAQDTASVGRGAKHSHHLCNSCNIKQNVVPLLFCEKLLKTNENCTMFLCLVPPSPRILSLIN